MGRSDRRPPLLAGSARPPRWNAGSNAAAPRWSAAPAWSWASTSAPSIPWSWCIRPATWSGCCSAWAARPRAGGPRRGLVLTARAGGAARSRRHGRLRPVGPVRAAAGRRVPARRLCQQLLGMAAQRSGDAGRRFPLMRRAYPLPRPCRARFRRLPGLPSGRDPAATTGCRPACAGGRRLLVLRRAHRRLLRRNLGTILAERSACGVQAGAMKRPTVPIGEVDESFADRLQPGDRFLLDGRCLEFRRREEGRAAGRGGGRPADAPRLAGRWLAAVGRAGAAAVPAAAGGRGAARRPGGARGIARGRTTGWRDRALADAPAYFQAAGERQRESPTRRRCWSRWSAWGGSTTACTRR